MGKLYCPFCNPKYQFSKRDRAGNLYCGLCGEYLIKKRLISIRGIVSLVAIFSIMLPMFLILFSTNNFKYKNKEYYQVNNQKINKKSFKKFIDF